MTKIGKLGPDPEIAAIGAVHKVLNGLAAEAQARVLKYVAGKLKIDISSTQSEQTSHQEPYANVQDSMPSPAAPEGAGDTDDGLEGISPVARKWMTRNNLKADALGTIFSLGVDEIDLVAKAVPGDGKKDKMHSVLLLEGIAAYIGGGVARFAHERLKEACLHYHAYDANNFATYMKSFSGDASGDKRGGYALTARGLTSATALVKQMIQPNESRR